MDKYITVADFGSFAVVEPVKSDSTLMASARIAEFCSRREEKNRRVRERRRDSVFGLFGAIAAAVIPAVMLLHWCFIGY